MKKFQSQIINQEQLSGAEKVIFKSTITFSIRYLGLTQQQAEQKGFEKIANIREMNKQLSNPKSKAYFPY